VNLASQTEAIAAAPVTARVAKSPWIYRPWLDLLIGCGGWSAPLLAVALWLTPSHTHAWAVAFYFLAMLFNYPHFMATVYRAYRTREDFERYKYFTLHFTFLLVLTGALLHARSQFLPWVFTLYICWSPWHYTGQNYGLLLMFVRRGGNVMTTAERRWLRAAFVASFLMLLASFQTGVSSDHLILSLGLPAVLTLPLRLALGLAFLSFTVLAFRRLLAEKGFRPMAAPLTLAFTQFLWFVLPTLLELHADYQIPQTRYSSGILAVLHSTQYIWITSYYQQRQERTLGKSGWRMSAYLLTLFAGGIALFVPGPWLVSYAFHFDFTTSFLIFLSVINIHHFLLDGALWKLRDSRIASLLVEQQKLAADVLKAPQASARRSSKRTRSHFLPTLVRFAPVAVLFLWGGMDQVHYAYRTADGNLPALRRAAQMNPYDSLTEERIAFAESKNGHPTRALEAIARATEINPRNLVLQQELARALIQGGRYTDAYAHYQKVLTIFPRDPDILINYGLLSSRLGNSSEAIHSWQRALVVDPNQSNAHLYLAETFDKLQNPAAGVQHWAAFLMAASTQQAASGLPLAQKISATIQFADDEARLNHAKVALSAYQSAANFAERSGNSKLESLALAHLADEQDKSGENAAAVHSYQRALALDATNGDSRVEGADWFNYGQFLRQHSLPDDLVYACFLKAERLLTPGDGQELETVRSTRRQVGARLGTKAADVQKDVDAQAARALAISTF
jgi:tetratricopeptide (TPR) repeat protein